MSNNGEGMGRLTAEDIAAINGQSVSEEALMEYLKKTVEDVEKYQAEARKSVVLQRAAVIVANLPAVYSTVDAAARAFDILEALDAEYERRKKS